MSDRYTVEQVAELFGCHPETIRRWIRSGKIRALRPCLPGTPGYVIPSAEVARLRRGVAA